MNRYLLVLLLSLAMMLLPSVAEAQFLAKQKVVVWSVFDRNNDVEVAESTKNQIRTAIVDALVNSSHYEAFEGNMDDVKNRITAQGFAMSPVNIAKTVGKLYNVKFVLFTTIKVVQHSNSYDNYQVLLTSDLVSTETQKNEKTAYVEMKTDLNAISGACAELLSKLLGEQMVTQSQSSQMFHSTQQSVATYRSQKPDEQAELWYAEGMGVYKNGQYKEAVDYFRKAAERGCADAQYKLGDCYVIGRGVTQNLYAAVLWYRKAAEQGHADAQYEMGFSYSNGIGGTKKNETEAVAWFRAAAEQGNLRAQIALGTRYRYGWGVTKNYNEAVKWYRKAAEQGDEASMKALQELGM